MDNVTHKLLTLKEIHFWPCNPLDPKYWHAFDGQSTNALQRRLYISLLPRRLTSKIINRFLRFCLDQRHCLGLDYGKNV